MSSIQFVIAGISGDVSKRKVLPAIKEFVVLNPDTKINLYGLSRSVVDTNEMQSIVGEYDNLFINLIQYDYRDSELISNILSSAEYTIVYLALPPVAFVNLLNLFCFLDKSKFDIVIEKPFASNFDEYQNILNIVQNCRLEKNVHFFDHYMFKPGLDFDKYYSEFDDLFDNHVNKISKIHIRALEKIGIEGRGNYYDKIGAIKDMIFHLFSMLLKLYRKIGNVLEVNDLDVRNIVKAQYNGYRDEVDNHNSLTETYFLIDSFDKKNGIHIIFESGKKQPEKETSIEIFFNNGDIIKIFIAPDMFIKVFSNGQEKKIYASQDLPVYQEHVIMFHSLINKDKSNFWKKEDIYNVWQFVENI
ncbi:MAG: hypothetical protein N3A71_02545 [Candidatus Dojkabacteria bacterium]|nr:hypothetical protein [Candidatus Dojkabacteria bacterium]